MENYEYMSQGSSTFLIKDEELKKGYESPFVKVLHSEGFKTWGVKGYYDGIDWIYVNINNKRYAFGIPGVAITEPVGEHAITIEEFLIIYDIYKKYDSEYPLNMEWYYASIIFVDKFLCLYVKLKWY